MFLPHLSNYIFPGYFLCCKSFHKVYPQYIPYHAYFTPFHKVYLFVICIVTLQKIQSDSVILASSPLAKCQVRLNWRSRKLSRQSLTKHWIFELLWQIKFHSTYIFLKLFASTNGWSRRISSISFPVLNFNLRNTTAKELRILQKLHLAKGSRKSVLRST